MSIFELAASGQLGELRLGDSIERIIQTFGEPDDTLADDPAALIKYGDFELIFDGGALAVIHCEFGSPPGTDRPDGTRLGIDTTELRWPLDLDATADKAAQAGLDVSRSSNHHSTTATFGFVNLTVHHEEQAASMDVTQRSGG